jgi:hypothetical protein
LLAEEKTFDRGNSSSANSQTQAQRSRNSDNTQASTEKSLNVAAFVKKFCENDQPAPIHSPISLSQIPLWLQQENSFQPYSDSHPLADDGSSLDRRTGFYSTFHPRARQQIPRFDDSQDQGYQMPSTQRTYPDTPIDSFAQAFSDSFDVKSVNWFDDLLGLAPSNSI